MTLGKLHMRIQGLKSTREKPLDIYLEGKRKKNVVLCTTVDPSTKNEEKFTHIYEDASPSHKAEEINTYMSCMYMVLMSS